MPRLLPPLAVNWAVCGAGISLVDDLPTACDFTWNVLAGTGGGVTSSSTGVGIGGLLILFISYAGTLPFVGGGGGSLLDLGIVSIEFRILSSLRDRLNPPPELATMLCGRTGGSGGGGSQVYEEHRLATDGEYMGEYVPGSWT